MTTEIDRAMSRYLGTHAVALGAGKPAAAPARSLVVAGVDDSANGFLAVEHATEEARLRGWPLRIVHVQDVIWRRQHHDEVRTEGADLLADAADRARDADSELAVSTQLRVGSPAGELVRASHEAGLVVVGARGRGGVAELLVGSVAEHVAMHASAPVMLVRVPLRPAGLPPHAHPIVVGVDGSAASQDAFLFALAEARLRGLGLLVVYASANVAELGADPLAQGVLSEIGDECMGIVVRRRHIRKDPRSALVDVSENASALVVGDHGLGRARGSRTRSVAHALIRQAHSPVFVVHSGQAASVA